MSTSVEEKVENNEPTEIDVDNLFKIVGEFSLYQFVMLVLIGLLCTIPAIVSYSFAFTGATPDFR